LNKTVWNFGKLTSWTSSRDMSSLVVESSSRMVLMGDLSCFGTNFVKAGLRTSFFRLDEEQVDGLKCKQ
jgi:hypothetical protein